MDASTITHSQREALQRRTASYRDYLVRLCARMESVAWSTTDPVYVAAVNSGSISHHEPANRFAAGLSHR